jgi:release factor glutamine methyltransferase
VGTASEKPAILVGMRRPAHAADSRRHTVERLRSAGCVFAEDEARILHETATTHDELASLLERRVAGEPLEQVVGWAEFAGLRIVVEPGVFVPRRRTECLAGLAASGAPARAVVVDLCCGSGAVGVAVATLIGDADLHAADADPAAVRCARRNVRGVGGRVYEGDLDQPLPSGLRGRVDVLVANPPYVPTAELALMPAEARLYEPRPALDGGPDGLDIARRVCELAPGWLAPGGRLLVETSEPQADRLAASARRPGLIPRIHRCEELDATVLVATAPTPPDDGPDGSAGR